VAELKTIVSDEKIDRRIMQKKLTDVEFTAEVSRTKNLRNSSLLRQVQHQQMVRTS